MAESSVDLLLLPLPDLSLPKPNLSLLAITTFRSAPRWDVPCYDRAIGIVNF